LIGTAVAGKAPFSSAFSAQNSFFAQTRLTYSPLVRTMASSAAEGPENAVTHAPKSLLPDWMLPERTRLLTTTKDLKKNGKCVVYWMQRDVRSVDNWALLFAGHMAETANVPLQVLYVLPPPPKQQSDGSLPPAMDEMRITERHGSFLLGGLEKVHAELASMDVPLSVLTPPSFDAVGKAVCEFLDRCQPQVVVCDMNPLRRYRQWIEEQTAPMLEDRSIPMYQVDAHNVVPVWHASQKKEVGARTLRPKLNKLSSKFLQSYPAFKGNGHVSKTPKPTDFEMEDYVSHLNWDSSVKSVSWAQPGTDKALNQFQFFLENGLKNFDSLRNDPNHRNVCSNLSPWINHGHVSFQKLAKDVKALNKYANGAASYIEEGLVRRELSDNYVYYSPDDYDTLLGAAGWAQESLELHASDEREYTYTLDELEQGMTHDDLWNAAELQLLQEGKMHGFLRMYWAKKILEWTSSPEIALRTAQYLNDKYALDGNDPNGFVGVGWSIMGIHDMGWKERPIFGKIRYMNYNGCKRKFKVADFVERYPGASEHAIAAAEKLGIELAPAKKTKKKSGTKRKASSK
jgi:deoxyribodipyrimidine photo-lyase